MTNTEEALNKGTFGTPSFSVGNEIFWGDDMLEDAIVSHRETMKQTWHFPERYFQLKKNRYKIKIL